MTTATKLSSTVSFSGGTAAARWNGRTVADAAIFRDYVRVRVKPRINDEVAGIPFANELQAMASTGMNVQFVKKLLESQPQPQPWEIGEALAECMLTDDDTRDISWPWNLVRDRRTPRASLPGADLVGFCKDAVGFLLLFGEVKTSSDAASPPNVMYGSSGMTWQLEADATNLAIQLSLLKWLRPRCTTPEAASRYKEAVGRYIKSSGKELMLIGVLLRDTKHNEADVKSRSTALAQKLPAPTRTEIVAWYLPTPIGDWAALLAKEAA